MIISLVAAAGNHNVIGGNNKLLWKMPTDMKFFMNLTMSHSVIMGRKTYESFGRPLKNRRNIVITRDKNLNIEGCEVVNSLEEALNLVKEDKEVFIIGGANIYAQSMDLANKIYLTRIFGDFEGDAYFPSIDDKAWLLTAITEHKQDEKNPYPFAFLEYVKK
jgi:dihydrofolate reductase